MVEFNNLANTAISLEKIVMQILQKNGLLKGNKLFGVVEQVINETKLKVYLEAEMRSMLVNCPPRIAFEIGDRVLIENINNNPHDRFVMALIEGVSKDTEVIDYDSLPTEPMEIVRDENGKAYKFIFAYDNPKTLWTQEITRLLDNKAESVISTYPDGMVFVRWFIRDEKGRVWKYE
ncbi:MAG: hypothetical protein ACLUCH_07955 [Lachnospirales bacterium]